MRTNSNRIKFVVFDLGGVLIRIHPERFYKRVFGKKAVSARLIRLVQEELQTGKRGVRAVFKDLKKKFALALPMEELIEAFKKSYIGKKIPGMERLVRDLKKHGFRLCILSNTNAVHIGHVRSLFDGFKDFTRLFFSHRLHLLKPGKKIFCRMLRTLRAAPEEVLYIDDTAENIRSAASLKIRCLKVRMNHPDPEAVREYLSLQDDQDNDGKQDQ